MEILFLNLKKKNKPNKIYIIRNLNFEKNKKMKQAIKTI